MVDRRALHEMTRDLALVASGARPADVVIRGGRWVNVHSGEIIDGTDVAGFGGRIAYCGPDASSMIGPETQVIEAGDRYLVPGLVDAHMHIESTMLTVRAFAEAVLPHGTTTVFIDPHEMANVFGLDGVRLMAQEAKVTPMQIYVQVPSCVPAAPGLETSGAEIGPAEVAEAMRWEGVIGLGEVMNYPGVAMGDEKLHAEIGEALKAGGVIGGHYASPDLGSMFHAYAAGGPSDCHEGTRVQDVVARVRQGMVAMVRESSAWRDVAAQVKAITEGGIDPRYIVLCTDDRNAGTLVREGHMDDVVRTAIAAGVEPMTAIRMATLGTAEHFGVAKDIGSITPGRFADILLVSDLENLAIDQVIAAGETVGRDGSLVVSIDPFAYPNEVKESLRHVGPLDAAAFEIPGPGGGGSARCRVIEIIEQQAPTRATIAEVPVREGLLAPSLESDIALLGVVERHRGSGRIGHGLVCGFGFDVDCALASSVAHDSHNLLVMGTDTRRMAEAANRVREMNGGVCLIGPEGVLAQVPLPIAGLLSEGSADEVAAAMDGVYEGLRACGCTIHDAFMTFSLLALPVIPQLRVTDMGVVDVDRFEIVPLFIGVDNR
ncbi:adenine deaminase [Candidatus Bipolaricaulota bacterium]